MKALYLGGNYGYGHAKQALATLVKLSKPKERNKYYMNNLPEVDGLKIGAGKVWLLPMEC
jgi:tryptophanyl-tRNA synthetase